MYSRTKLANQAIKETKKYFSGKIYNTVIPRNVRLAEAPSYGKPIITYDPKCKGAKAYRNLSKEIIGNDIKKINNKIEILPRRIKDFWNTGKPPKHAVGRK